jgi:putative DNA primase/helicase
MGAMALWSQEVYINLGVRHPGCTPHPRKRGTADEVYALPGLLIDLDHAGGTHSARNLPTREELLAFIEKLPCTFSLLIDSGGGIHGYLLFREAWILDSPGERDRATRLLKRFQHTIRTHAAGQGWGVDDTADLPRLLRPAGTLNHKSEPATPVTILHEDAIRYNPSELEDRPWLAPAEEPATSSHREDTTGTGRQKEFPPASLESIVQGCAWLGHCRDDAAMLSEPEWYAMLGIVGRCVDGEQLAQEWSASYSGYTPEETTQKLEHALTAAGPRTCKDIRQVLGGEEYCRTCQHWGKVKSPIVLGMPRKKPQRETKSAKNRPEDVPSSILAGGIAEAWRDTMVFDLGRQAFMQYERNLGIFRELVDAEIDAEIRLCLEQRLLDGFSGGNSAT